MDSDDAIDAKNIAGAGTKRRVDRTPCSSSRGNPVLISPRSAMDSDDAEGAELPPVDAKNIAGAGTKRWVDRAHDPSRLTHGVRGAGASAAALAGAELPPVDAEEKNMSGAGKKRRVDATANTHGETNGAAATYVTPPRPRPPHTPSTHTPSTHTPLVAYSTKVSSW